jgi:hypothetical protein
MYPVHYDAKDSRTADVWTIRSTYSHRSTVGPRNTHIYSASNVCVPYRTTVVCSVVFTRHVKIISPFSHFVGGQLPVNLPRNLLILLDDDFSGTWVRYRRIG